MAGLTLFGFVGASLYYGGLFTWRIVPSLLGIRGEEQIHGFRQATILIAALFVVIVVLIYAAVVAWLLFAKLFFVRSQVEAVARWGPTSRLDRWLIDRFFPEREGPQ